MSWNTPITFTTGNVLTAAQMNSQVRDNENYLFDQPMALVSKVGTTSIANSILTTFVFGTTNWSSPGITVTLATTSLKPTFAGVYECWANVVWAGSAAGYRFTAITNGGNGQLIAESSSAASSGSDRLAMSLSGVTDVVLNGTTDNVQFLTFQDSGIAQTVFGTGTTSTNFVSAEPCFFGIKMLGTGS